MKKIPLFFLLAALSSACKKVNTTAMTGCDMQEIYTDNAKKLTIAKGVWGTIASTEGNCMPVVPQSTGPCSHTCPVHRTVKIYEYTLPVDASYYAGDFYNSFKTSLIGTTDADENGFYQISVPSGRYSIAILENGLLYANSSDSAGALCPFVVAAGTEKVNLTMTYKLTF